MTDQYAPPPGYAAGPAVTPPAAIAPAPQRRNVAGLISFILGIVLLVTMTVNLVAQIALVTSGGYLAMSGVLAILGFLQTALALGAIVAGVIGLVRKDLGKALAGIGLGIGIAVLWSNIGGWAFGPLMRLFG